MLNEMSRSSHKNAPRRRLQHLRLRARATPIVNRRTAPPQHHTTNNNTTTHSRTHTHHTHSHATSNAIWNAKSIYAVITFRFGSVSGCSLIPYASILYKGYHNLKKSCTAMANRDKFMWMHLDQHQKRITLLVPIGKDGSLINIVYSSYFLC